MEGAISLRFCAHIISHHHTRTYSIHTHTHTVSTFRWKQGFTALHLQLAYRIASSSAVQCIDCIARFVLMIPQVRARERARAHFVSSTFRLSPRVPESVSSLLSFTKFLSLFFPRDVLFSLLIAKTHAASFTFFFPIPRKWEKEEKEENLSARGSGLVMAYSFAKRKWPSTRNCTSLRCNAEYGEREREKRPTRKHEHHLLSFYNLRVRPSITNTILQSRYYNNNQNTEMGNEREKESARNETKRAVNSMTDDDPVNNEKMWLETWNHTTTTRPRPRSRQYRT